MRCAPSIAGTSTRPSGAKGNYVKKVAVSSSMGAGVKVDLTTLSA
jgi:large subunit ribosomal protein L1